MELEKVVGEPALKARKQKSVSLTLHYNKSEYIPAAGRGPPMDQKPAKSNDIGRHGRRNMSKINLCGNVANGFIKG